ncbi:MAG: hypothetical protein MI924_10940 [Chloroflexales bacterium]|nr:hypothetical protein [Chloroflexales bacterium]
MTNQQRQRRTTSNRANKPADLEEIRPQHFLLRNPMARGVLKGEGRLEGNRFELTTWRRDGLLARLRNSGFTVETLDDQIARLPDLPIAVSLGAFASRVLHKIERYSYFDPQMLGWAPLEAQQEEKSLVVRLRDGWVVRRRRGRGAASYHQVFIERSGIAGLTLLTTPEAFLQGYAQAAQISREPLVVQRLNQHYLLPALELPAPHHALLQRLGDLSAEGWRIDERGWPLACVIYKRLGIHLVAHRT